MTKIINLFAGPGAGKSTTAAGLFHLLKLRGVNCELVHEFAKDLTWRDRYNTLACQPYVFGKQLERITSLIGKVDFVITDSPILLSVVYSGDKWPVSFNRSVADIFNMYDNVNYILKRSKDYLQVGRSQTLEEAESIDSAIKFALVQYSHTSWKIVDGDSNAPSKILEDIEKIRKNS